MEWSLEKNKNIESGFYWFIDKYNCYKEIISKRKPSYRKKIENFFRKLLLSKTIFREKKTFCWKIPVENYSYRKLFQVKIMVIENYRNFIVIESNS